MPRNVVLALAIAGCSFHADYQSGHTTCDDGRCPSGLVCDAMHVCVTSSPAADAMPSTDSHIAALTCADPGELASGIAAMGTTVGRGDLISASCAGSIMNGPDAEYAIAITAGQSLVVTVTAEYAATAYVLAACTPTPATPACVGNMAASADGPATTIDPGAAGTYYVVVDSALAAGSGAYTLIVSSD